MRIKCPHCGIRPVEEFTMKGDADLVRPESGDPGEAGDPSEAGEELAGQWHDYVYLRDNPMGRLSEYWHHAGGCRAWLVVTRDTVTHEIYSVATASDHARQRPAP